MVVEEVVDFLVGADELFHAEQGCAGPAPLERMVFLFEGVGDEVEQGFVVDVGAVVVAFRSVAEGVEGEVANGAARSLEEREVVFLEESGGAGRCPEVAGGEADSMTTTRVTFCAITHHRISDDFGRFHYGVLGDGFVAINPGADAAPRRGTPMVSAGRVGSRGDVSRNHDRDGEVRVGWDALVSTIVVRASDCLVWIKGLAQTKSEVRLREV